MIEKPLSKSQVQRFKENNITHTSAVYLPEARLFKIINSSGDTQYLNTTLSVYSPGLSNIASEEITKDGYLKLTNTEGHTRFFTPNLVKSTEWIEYEVVSEEIHKGYFQLIVLSKRVKRDKITTYYTRNLAFQMDNWADKIEHLEGFLRVDTDYGITIYYTSDLANKSDPFQTGETTEEVIDGFLKITYIINESIRYYNRDLSNKTEWLNDITSEKVVGDKLEITHSNGSTTLE